MKKLPSTMTNNHQIRIQLKLSTTEHETEQTESFCTSNTEGEHKQQADVVPITQKDKRPPRNHFTETKKEQASQEHKFRVQNLSMREESSPTTRLLLFVLLRILIIGTTMMTWTATVLLGKAIHWRDIKDENVEAEEFSGHVTAKLLSEEVQLRPCKEVWLQGGRKGK